MEDAHALGVRLRLRCAAAQPCVGSRRAGCRSAKVNETQGGLRDAAEYSTGDAPAAAARRPLSGLHAAAGLGFAAAVRLAVPHGRWTLGARRRRGAACRHPKQTPCCHRADTIGTSRHWHQLPKCRYGWCQRVTPGCNARRQAPPALSSRRRWSPGRIHSCYCYYHQLYTRDDTSRTMPPPAAAVCHSELGELIS